MITVIITIIVIIIITAISFYSLTTQETAVVAKYVQEFEELRKNVETKRLSNAKNGIENANNGFSRVYINGEIPYNFSFFNSSGEQFAYLVSLDYLQSDEMATGRDYERFEQDGNDIKTVNFGKDDVYVYDSTGRLFYARGFEYNGTIHHDEIKENTSIKILEVKKEFINNKEAVKVTFKIECINEIASVKVKDSKGNTKEVDGEEVFEITIDKNGDYEIIAEDNEGNKDTENLKISGIGSEGEAPTVSATVTNGTLENGVYNVKGNTVNVKIVSDNAKYLYIGNNNAQPTSWLPFTENIEKTYSSEGDKTLYVWVKDENDLVCDAAYQIELKIVFDDGERPQAPDENVSGDIEFMLTPDNDTWSNEKQLTITFTEGRQSNGYQSMYRTKSGLSGWSRWTVSYESIVNINITRNNTEVEARIIYMTDYKNVEVATGSITVNKVDGTPPRLTSLKLDKDINGENIVIGTAEDTEAGIHSTAPYLITTQEINFKYVTDIDSFAWQANNYMEARKNAKYYFYVRDNANNVGYGTVNADALDKTAPVINEIISTPILDYADVRIIATDNIGIVEYALTKNDSDTQPTNWKEIAEEDYILINYRNIREDCKITIWVKDEAGNVSKATVIVKLHKFPELDETYPQDIYIKQDDIGKFEVVITKSGDPDAYEWQWQESVDNGATWTPVQGATEQIYTYTALYTNNNKLFRCEITHARGVMYSPVAKLEVAIITKTTPDLAITEDKEMVLGGVIINKGQMETNNATLSLDILALNASEMSISETDTKGAWQPYRETTEYTLTNTTSGTKTINVWIRDSEGNELLEKVTAEIEYTP